MPIAAGARRVLTIDDWRLATDDSLQRHPKRKMQMQPPDPVRLDAGCRLALFYRCQHQPGVSDVQVRRIQLISQSQSNGANRSLITETTAERVAQVGISLQHR
jgi:hypothetical protein